MTLNRFVDSNGKLVVLGKELGVGGQGAVHLVDGRPGEVAKVYLKPPSAADIRKIEAQVQACRPEILSISAWPSALLKNSAGGVQGLIMPLVDPEAYTEIHNLFGPASRRKYFPKADWAFLIHVARNIARAFTVVHSGGHVVGDVSSRNILVSQQGTLQMIDTDSFQVRAGTQVFPCPVGTAESTPPELQGQSFGTFLRNENHDLFGMAVLIFQLLFQGRHPYSGIHDDGSTPNPAEAIKGNKFAYAQAARGVRPPPQTLRLADLLDEVGTLFERAFAASAGQRPTAKEWDQGLARLSQSLVQCKQDVSHRHVAGKRCSWCALNHGATAKAGFAPGAKRLDVQQELNRVWKVVQTIPKPSAPILITLPTNITPLAIQMPALPVVQPLPKPTQQIQAAKTRRSISIFLYGVFAILVWQGGGLWLDLSVGLIAWVLFVKSNTKKIEQTHLKAQEDQQWNAKKQHESEKNKLRQQLVADNKQSQHQLNALLLRRQNESAVQKYQTTLNNVESSRASILSLVAEEPGVIQRVRDECQRRALDQYLSRQILTPGEVPGIGPQLIASLQQRGIQTALDITDQVRWIGGIGPKRATDLMLWRKVRERFFNFDPASVPISELSAALTAHDQKLMEKLQLLASDVTKFAAEAQTWKAKDEVLKTDIQAKMVEIERRRLALQKLEEVRL